MNNKDIEFLVHRIISGNQIFSDNNIVYELRKPSVAIKLKADEVYQSAYEENIFNNFYFEEDLDGLLIEQGLIGPFFQKDLESVEKRLSQAKINLFKNWTDIKQRKKYKQDITQLKNSVNKLYQAKHSLDFLTIENYCDNIRNQYTIVNCLFYDNTNNRVFDDHEQIDYGLFNHLMQIIANNVIDIAEYKAMARHDYWRNYYNTNRTNVFGCAAIELSEEQRALLNTSIMYDRVYEHPDCPEPDIVNDDDALEGWMLHQQEENKKQKQQKGVDNMLSSKVKNSSEIFLMAQDKEQKDTIWGLNSPESQSKIQEKTQTVLNSTSPVKENELPDVQRTIRQKIAELNKR